MKILVGIKRVVDYNVRIRVKSDGSGIDTDGVKMSINPFDEIALEEALRIKERGEASEVIAVSIGSSEAQQQLRTGLAMGADRAILVQLDGDIDPLSIARVFKHIADQVVFDSRNGYNINHAAKYRLGRLWRWRPAAFQMRN